MISKTVKRILNTTLIFLVLVLGLSFATPSQAYYPLGKESQSLSKFFSLNSKIGFASLEETLNRPFDNSHLLAKDTQINQFFEKLVAFELEGLEELVKTAKEVSSPFLAGTYRFALENTLYPPQSDIFYVYHAGSEPSDFDTLLSLLNFQARGVKDLFNTSRELASIITNPLSSFVAEGPINNLALLTPPKKTSAVQREELLSPLAQNLQVGEPQVLAETDELASLSQKISALENQISLLPGGDEIFSTTINLLKNSSFEQDTLNLSPRHWTYNNDSALKNTFANNGQVRSGNLSLRIKASGSEANYGIYQPDTKSKKDRSYVLSAYLFSDQTDNFIFRIGFWSRNQNKRIDQKEFSIGSQTGWQRYIHKITATEDNWFPYIEVLNLSTGNVYLDDFQLEEGTQVSVYKAGTGTTEIPGSSVLGDGAIIAEASGNLYPQTTNRGSLGTSTNKWDKLYLKNFSVDENGTLSASGDGSVSGTFTAGGKATFNGSVDLGDATADTIALNGRVGSSIIPTTDASYDLGSSSLQWRNLYLSGSTTSGGNQTISNTNPTLTFEDTTASEDDWNLNVDASSLVIRNTTDSSNYFTLSGTGDLTLTQDLAVNGGDLTTSATTFNLVNATATTVNFAGAGTTISLGAATGTTTVNNALTVTGTLTPNGTLTANGAFTLGDNGDTGSVNTSDWDISTTGDLSGIGTLALNGDITFSATTPNIAITDTETFTITDGTNTLFTLADGGTVGNVTVSGTLTSSGAFTASSTSTLAGDITFSAATPNITINNTESLTITDGTNTLFSLADGGTTGNLSGLGTLSLAGDITWSATTPTFTINNTETFAISDGTNTIFSLADGGTTGNLSGIGTLSLAGDITWSATTPNIAISNTESLTITDGTNTLFTLADGGTAGNLTVSGTGTFSSTANPGLIVGASGVGYLAIGGSGNSLISQAADAGNLTLNSDSGITDVTDRLAIGPGTISTSDQAIISFTDSGASSGTALRATTTAGETVYGLEADMTVFGTSSTTGQTVSVISSAPNFGLVTVSSYTLTNLRAFEAELTDAATGATNVITNFSGFFGKDPSFDDADLTVTNYYGVYLEDAEVTTATITNEWGIVQAGTDDLNKLAGRTTIGADATPATGIELDVEGQIQVDLAGTQTSVALCHSGAAGSGASVDNAEIVDCTGTPAADYAEFYPASQGVEPGDIVVASQNQVTTTTGENVSQLVKSSKAYEQNILGIVSDPKTLTDFNSIGYNVKAEDNPVPLALVGRVKAKVSAENGPIAVGDPLTSSSQAGVAMKATKTGPVVGKALESFNGEGIGKIMVFVNVSYYVGELSSSGQLAQNEDLGGVLGENTQFTIGVEPLNSPSPSPTPIALALPQDEQTIVDKVVETLASFGITIKDTILAIKEATIDKLAVKILTIDNEKKADFEPLLGEAKILAGQTTLEVQNTNAKENSKIFITFRGQAQDFGWSIKELKVDKSFTVEISKSQGVDLVFDYWIVQTTAKVQITPPPQNITGPAQPEVAGTQSQPGTTPTQVQQESSSSAQPQLEATSSAQ